MEVRRAADMLLRSNALPVASFLAPTCNIRWPTQRKALSRQAHPRCINRAFGTGSRKQAIQPPSTSSSAPSPESPESSTLSSEQAEPPKPEPETISSLSNSLWAKPSARPSPFAFRSSSDPSKPTNSAVEMLRNLASRPSRHSSQIDVSRMSDPAAPAESFQSKEEKDLMGALDLDLQLSGPPPAAKVPMRLDPSLGRSLHISEQLDPSRAFIMLDQSCGRNKIRQDLNRQRFHERPGLKRKRLRRERWRKRFNNGFKTVVARVKQLKQQGW
ncbi:hypothetical protein G7Y89_g9345 [Cudoniella acicularis]|uniref:Ribosomal protein S21 n=1 Tax=Cudoniella acicularis TaxID=354080 RepID=A0A8H4RFS5_9HELO|nr:hypothetical protein G7Y89_g9345 [Cudoniella acicularis]